MNTKEHELLQIRDANHELTDALIYHMDENDLLKTDLNNLMVDMKEITHNSKLILAQHDEMNGLIERILAENQHLKFKILDLTLEE